MGKFVGRIWWVIRIDASVYREVARDGAATRQAVLIYVLPAIVVTMAALSDPEAPTPITDFGIALLLVPVVAIFWTSSVQWMGVRVVGGPSPYGSLFRALGFAASIALLFIPIAVAGVLVDSEQVALPSGQAEILGISAILLASIWLAISLTLAIGESFQCRTGEAIRTLVGTVGLAIAIPIFLSLIIPYYVLRYLYRLYKRPGGPAPKAAAPSRLISIRMGTRRQRYRAGIRRQGWA